MRDDSFFQLILVVYALQAGGMGSADLCVWL
ncbi:hypothetical protein SPV1_02647 [Mariprofundus ferrooxydans PV-1]|uniref:Uncharacterized protein n=1 Tax=Mariprofundus ferrooxydans PV-1 TaxID=314345 RepID=Q0F1T9_9PROT|nr:hypothetical protein SPV1_02647 [Mariprofundus ferrooxydans PV-1]